MTKDWDEYADYIEEDLIDTNYQYTYHHDLDRLKQDIAKEIADYANENEGL